MIQIHYRYAKLPARQTVIFFEQFRKNDHRISNIINTIIIRARYIITSAHHLRYSSFAQCLKLKSHNEPHASSINNYIYEKAGAEIFQKSISHTQLSIVCAGVYNIDIGQTHLCTLSRKTHDIHQICATIFPVGFTIPDAKSSRSKIT